MKKNKKLIVLLASILAIVIIGGLVFPLFKGGYTGKTTEVLIASKDIKVGEKITQSNIETIEYPNDYIDDKKNIVLKNGALEQIATSDIYKGDVISAKKITNVSNKKKYESDLVAITVKTLASSVAGEIKAGDNVSVYGFAKSGEGENRLIAPATLSKMKIAYLKTNDNHPINSSSDDLVPNVVVLKVENENQAKDLVQLEYDAEIHLKRLK